MSDEKQVKQQRKSLLSQRFAKRLKTLKGRSPYEYICDRWQETPERFHEKPTHLNTGLYKRHLD